MNTDQVIAILEPWRAKQRKTALRPVTQAFDGEINASKFSGTPWISEQAPWPKCKCCHRPMQLFLQLNLDALPQPLAGKHGRGLLQLFYCSRDLDGSCESFGGWEPFNDAVSCVRIIQPCGHPILSSVPQEAGYFPAQTILEWEAFYDNPDPEEHEMLGLTYSYDWDTRTIHITCEAPEVHLEGLRDLSLPEEIAISASGDKLGGWPHWIQNRDFPVCPRCGQEMSFVLQIDSHDHLPYMFGDMGLGTLTQCPNHKEVVAFGWACC